MEQLFWLKKLIMNMKVWRFLSIPSEFFNQNIYFIWKWSYLKIIAFKRICLNFRIAFSKSLKYKTINLLWRLVFYWQYYLRPHDLFTSKIFRFVGRCEVLKAEGTSLSFTYICNLKKLDFLSFELNSFVANSFSRCFVLQGSKSTRIDDNTKTIIWIEKLSFISLLNIFVTFLNECLYVR